MSFLVDTDICSAYLKGHRLVFNRFMQYAGNTYMSVVTWGELCIWGYRASASAKRSQDLQDLLSFVAAVDVTLNVSDKFGEVQAGLMDQGLRAPDLDLLIAATALVHGFTLVTHNTQDYSMIPGLLFADWMIP